MPVVWVKLRARRPVTLPCALHTSIGAHEKRSFIPLLWYNRHLCGSCRIDRRSTAQALRSTQRSTRSGIAHRAGSSLLEPVSYGDAWKCVF
ncbi:hypothetical protein STCU_10529 [Strigomonas culicis]|uniref:Uncharacterized protein n=1 Tax=Strigomonas culicis TaxID=28005 RepID=S9THP4_9TRYP|nr:hypothetical protein STCU_10529 [Strigomonas culicis]|eukprot:EPY17557.1 hypothetical protein STCU_10529 [Strigomonas culicis]